MDGAATPGSRGPGIGLAAARKIGQPPTGRGVEMESGPGRGSTFGVWLPGLNDDGSRK